MSSAATLTPPVHAAISVPKIRPLLFTSRTRAHATLFRRKLLGVSQLATQASQAARCIPREPAPLCCSAWPGSCVPRGAAHWECTQCGLQDDHLVAQAPGAAHENALVERPRRFALPHGQLSVPQHILCDPSVSCGGMDPVGRLGGQPRRGTETLLFRPRSGLCKGASMHASPHAQLPDRALLRSCIRTC